MSILAPAPIAQESESAKVVDFIELEGVIDPVSSRYLLREIEAAEKRGSHFIVVRLDTPGGLDISMRDIVKEMLSAEVPIVVWVAPSGARAASAGVFITYAAHIAVMAPGTNIGAAHPVNLGGGQDDISTEKVTNDSAAYIRSIAKQRGRNEDWAESAVRSSVSLAADEAADEQVVDFVAGANDIYDKLDGLKVELDSGPVELDTSNVVISFHKMGFLERVLHAVVSPEIAYILVLIGMYGIIFELYNPGIGAGGVLGGVSLILGFYALSVLPTSWAGVALLVLGVAFLVIDLHTAGLGVFTIGGTVALVAGSVLLFAGAAPELRLAWWAIAGATLASLLFFIGAMTAAIRTRLSRPASGAEGLISMEGVARSDVAPDGQVFVKGTVWRAKTKGAAIPEGSPVRVVSITGLMLEVEPIEVPTESGG